MKTFKIFCLKYKDNSN